jgi:hypothetical protein
VCVEGVHECVVSCDDGGLPMMMSEETIRCTRGDEVGTEDSRG